MQRLLITLDTELVLTTFEEVYKKLRLLYFAICVLLLLVFFIATANILVQWNLEITNFYMTKFSI